MLSPSDYAVIVEQSPILIWRVGPLHGVRLLQRAMARVHGPDDGAGARERLGRGGPPGGYRIAASQIFTSSFAARQPFEMEYRLRRHDGAWRWIHDRGVPSHDPAGRFVGFIGSCTDVTGRVEAERTLEAARQAELSELRELIPVCAHCKQVRDDKGYWHRVESYMTRVTRKQVSHGICPTCREKFYPGL